MDAAAEKPEEDINAYVPLKLHCQSSSSLLFAITLNCLCVIACAFNRVTIVQGATLNSSRFCQEEHASMHPLLHFYVAIRNMKYSSFIFRIYRALCLFSSQFPAALIPHAQLTLLLQVLINCRNNHKLIARVKAFDRHCNM
jgi:hypothetical protein